MKKAFVGQKVRKHQSQEEAKVSIQAYSSLMILAKLQLLSQHYANDLNLNDVQQEIENDYLFRQQANQERILDLR